MPTLIVDNVPTDVYECLRQRAAAGRRTLHEETLDLLEHALIEDLKPKPRLPEFIPNEEICAPFDLPRSSQPVTVLAVPGEPRLPDPRIFDVRDERT